MTRLVIFDCDGVLVDSETISLGVLLEALREWHVVIGEAEAYRLFLGRSMASIGDVMRERYGLDLSPAHLDAIRDRLYARFRAELRAVPHTREVVSSLDTPSCVASSSQPERIRFSLDLAGLLACFEPRIYSSTMVERGKPAPDLFLHAAREMGVDREDCVVVEDSPAGIEAARRAGMRVLAFVGGAHAGPGQLRETVAPLRPDAIFDDMRDLPGLLAGLPCLTAVARA